MATDQSEEAREAARQAKLERYETFIHALERRCMEQNEQTKNEKLLEDATKENVQVDFVPYSALSRKTPVKVTVPILLVGEQISKAHRERSVHWADENYGTVRVPDELSVNWFTHQTVSSEIRNEIAKLAYPVPAHHMAQLLSYYVPEKIKAVFIDAVVTDGNDIRNRTHSLLGQAIADVGLILMHATSKYVCGPRYPKPSNEDTNFTGQLPDLRNQLSFFAKTKAAHEIEHEKFAEIKQKQAAYDEAVAAAAKEKGKKKSKGALPKAKKAKKSASDRPEKLKPTEMRSHINATLKKPEWRQKIETYLDELMDESRAFFKFAMEHIVQPEVSNAASLALPEGEVKRKFQNIFVRELREISFNDILKKKPSTHTQTKALNQANLKAGKLKNALFDADGFAKDILPESHSDSRNFVFTCDLKTRAYFSKFDHSMGRRIISSAVYGKQLSLNDYYSPEGAPISPTGNYMATDAEVYNGKKHDIQLQEYNVPGVFDITNADIVRKLKFARVVVPKIEDIWFFCLPSQVTEKYFLFSLENWWAKSMPINNWKPFALREDEWKNKREGITKTGVDDPNSPFYNTTNQYKFKVRWNFFAECDGDKKSRNQKGIRASSKATAHEEGDEE